MHEVAGSSPASATTPTSRRRPGFVKPVIRRQMRGGDTLASRLGRRWTRYALNLVGSLVGLDLLVVEDDKDARDVSCAMLDSEGAMVLGAASAEEGLSILRTVRPHAIITEIALPGRDGFLLLEQLRSSKRTEKIPVVALTAVAGR